MPRSTRKHSESLDFSQLELDELYALYNIKFPHRQAKHSYNTRSKSRNRNMVASEKEKPPIQNTVNVYSSSYPIPRFNAKTDDIEQLFKQFEDAKKQHRWTEEQAKEFLPTTFVGKSRDWVQLRIKNLGLKAKPYEGNHTCV